MAVKVKICGLTSTADVQIINKELPDYAGIVMFYPKSKRNRTKEQAQKLLSLLNPAVTAVAVLVSPTKAQIQEISDSGFGLLQIHGTLSDDVLAACSLPVWKAFNLSDLPDISRFGNCPRITGYVFDAAEPGSGRTFDWNQLKSLPQDGRLRILAGGLTPENVITARKAVSPDVVDVSSSVEFTDGRPGKDPEKVKKFIDNARHPLSD